MHKSPQGNFDIWNNLKKELEGISDVPQFFPKTGEVWMCSLGKNIGFEQNGGGANFSRPVLIVKKFNNHMFWCVPLSTKQKKLDFYLNFTDPQGLDVSMILAQLKLISLKRFRRKLYEIKKVEMAEVKSRLISLME
jgi:mRNA interferase MazF